MRLRSPSDPPAAGGHGVTRSDVLDSTPGCNWSRNLTHLPSAATDTVESRSCCSPGLTHIHSEQATTRAVQPWKMSTASFCPSLLALFSPPLLPSQPSAGGSVVALKGFILLKGSENTVVCVCGGGGILFPDSCRVPDTPEVGGA